MVTYTDPRAEEWLVRCLIERRDRIGRAYLSRVLPLDDFRFERRELSFTDLELAYGFVASRDYTIQWSLFDNMLERHTMVGSTKARTWQAASWPRIRKRL